jgi:hypothetical protein
LLAKHNSSLAQGMGLFLFEDETKANQQVIQEATVTFNKIIKDHILANIFLKSIESIKARQDSSSISKIVPRVV